VLNANGTRLRHAREQPDIAKVLTFNEAQHVAV
jgi:hypothetical protein